MQIGPRLLHTVPVEEVLNVHPDVQRTALVAAQTPAGETVPVICVELSPDTRRSFDQIAPELSALADRGPPTQGLSLFLEHPSFPVDVRHNAKINNESLSTWAAEAVSRRASLGLPGHEEGP